MADVRRIYGVQTVHCWAAGRLFTSESNVSEIAVCACPTALTNSLMAFSTIFSLSCTQFSQAEEDTVLFAVILFLILSNRIQTVAPLVMGIGHFCLSLTVACEFRLCLHPGGMLRVQSLHLPCIRAWLGVFC